ncbi:MAG: hypothetical protein ACK58L_05260, partial [Planctomycetota bacterium]
AVKVHAPVDVGHRASTIVHLSNSAARVGQVLEFDPARETITNNETAAAMIGRMYRDAHWAVPQDAGKPA